MTVLLWTLRIIGTVALGILIVTAAVVLAVVNGCSQTSNNR